MKFKIGETDIEVKAEGCFRCGTRWSRGWYPLKQVPVQIGSHKEVITISVCDDCATPDEKGTSQMALEG